MDYFNVVSVISVVNVEVKFIIVNSNFDQIAASQLYPNCIPNAFLMHPNFMQTASLINPNCIPTARSFPTTLNSNPDHFHL